MNHLYTSKFQVVNIAPSLLQHNTPPTSDSSNMSPTLPSPPSNSSISNTPTAASADSDKKRLTACLVCRKRKLKCDFARPKCASCARLGHACGYEETRKKSGPKQGYVKKLEQKSQTLEQRLAQLEKLLATHHTQQQQPASSAANANGHLPTPPGISPLAFESVNAPASANQFSGLLNPSVFSTNQPIFPDLTPPENDNINLGAFPLFTKDTTTSNNPCAPSTTSNTLQNSWAWDLVSLGIQEELPPEEITNKLAESYFAKMHNMVPILHRSRFISACQLPPNIGVPVSLRYIVWALGAATSTDPNLRAYKDVFYARARRSLTELLDTTLDSLKQHKISTLQALVLMTTYEFLHANFGHAWMNCGRAARMAVYFNLTRLDEPHLFCKQTLVDAKDWVDQEERRRTFWGAFIMDRFASIGTGWAESLNEDDITTFLPGPDDEYQAGLGILGENTGEPLYPSTKNSANKKPIGAFGATLRIVGVLGRLNAHVNRPNHEKDYMTRHRDLDNLLATIQFSTPQELKYVPGSSNMQNSFLQNLTSISTVLLNQAALYKCQLTELPLRLSDLASRCHMGAVEIANTIRQTSNVHVTYQCAYNSFCIYVGARVFVEMLRQPCPANAPNQGPPKEQLEGDLNMMVAALQNFTIHVPLAGHFLMQLEADMNGLEKLVSVRPYDVNVGYNECHIFYQQAATANAANPAEDAQSTKNTIWTKTPSGISSAQFQKDHTRSFDVRGMDRTGQEERLSYVDISRHRSSSNEGSAAPPTGSTSGSMSVSNSTPNTATPESIRQFDPDKFFGDLNLTGTGIDVTMNMGTTMDETEFFTEMLGVNLNGS